MPLQLKRWVLLILIFYAIGIYWACEDYVTDMILGLSEGWWSNMLGNLEWWTILGACSPLVFWVVRRIPPTTEHIYRNAIYYIAAIFAASAAHTALSVALIPQALSSAPTPMGFVLNNTWAAAQDNIILLAALLARQYYSTYYQNASAAAELEVSLTRAQVEALSTQVQPAMMFTALEAIATLARREPVATERAIVLLSEFLRATLPRGVDADVPLERESVLMEQYAEIMSIASHGRCRIDVEVSGEAQFALVPPFLCQQMLNGPVAHALATQTSVTITFHGVRQSDKLALEVSASGSEALYEPVPGARGSHHELADHLSRLYGRDASLTVDDGGRIQLTIPFRTSAKIASKTNHGMRPVALTSALEQ